MVSIYWYNALSSWLHNQVHIPCLPSGDRATSKSTGMLHSVVIVGILEKEFKVMLAIYGGSVFPHSCRCIRGSL